MDPISLILFIAIGGIMIGAGVHFIPVGGAPAAMATATGVGTGTAMLAAGAGLTGLITAATMTGEPFYIVGIGGAIGAMIMMGITMLIANLIYIFGVGIVPAASKVPVDWITKRNQEIYKTPGTEGHGVPLTSFVSGLIGGLLGGFGGGLVYYGIYDSVQASFEPAIAIGLAAILGVGVFFINSVIASYNIGGTIEGMHDPKFKRIGTGALACAIASIVVGIFCIILTGGI
ncbi:MAG: tetrahydromethanopterin S-methyltransferase subunit D [Methanobrevibacter sp.]|uniref:tetrahydromethanopterin S-methyltransferase subunit D n=2 Tax=Methanobrevibacter TaxID=2172 RepID=UPI0025CF73B7|nr:tetrahydromethanopterin S-methyltransferase subunit D [Methanobrevibacter sp.]MBR3113488.1 tetrahydromethanopterin S-methyltransferase subunit D [Methanobrevibacter sp.]MBR3155952.1 tetrahydromethanopterin S-methyltransferase subunit D [Methanobrevibacter sp.]MBR6994034.1 tetrahydromethanopterin S-methyltransferase subunit D [Methanobrevibacter sp.]